MYLKIILVIIVLFFLGILLNKILNKIKITFSILIRKNADKAIEINLVTVYRNNIDKTAEELKGAMHLLEDHYILITRLKRRLEADKSQHVQEVCATTLGSLEEAIKKNETRLISSEKSSKLQIEKIKKLKEQIVELKEKYGRLPFDLQTNKAEAKISELIKRFDSIGFDNLI